MSWRRVALITIVAFGAQTYNVYNWRDAAGKSLAAFKIMDNLALEYKLRLDRASRACEFLDNAFPSWEHRDRAI